VRQMLQRDVNKEVGILCNEMGGHTVQIFAFETRLMHQTSIQGEIDPKIVYPFPLPTGKILSGDEKVHLATE